MIRTVFQLLGLLISVYSLLVIVRMLMTWFSGPYAPGRAVEMLRQITDPYMNWFRRFTFLTIGGFDFSPVAALVALSVAGHIAASLAEYGRITVGIILALVVSGLWSAASFIIIIFLVLAAIRAVGIAVAFRPGSPAWRTIDYILNPLVLPVSRVFLGNRPTSYFNGLVLGSLVFLAAWLVGRFVVGQAVGLFARLPF